MSTKKKVVSKKADESEKVTPTVGEEVTRDFLAEMSHEGLILFARMQYGITNLSVRGTVRKDVENLIMEAARKFKGNAEMKVVEMNEEVEVPPGYVKIRVSPGDYNPNQRPIPIGLNFKTATIPVNKDVVMHSKWLPCLEDAVQTKYYVDRSDPRNETLASREQHSYPFSIIERG